jgi:hypothetical protein
MGVFDDLVPKPTAPTKPAGNVFDDLLPKGAGGAAPGGLGQGGASTPSPGAASLPAGRDFTVGANESPLGQPEDNSQDPTAQPFQGTNRHNPVNVLPRPLDFWGEYKEANRSSRETMSSGVDDIKQGSYLKGGFKAAAGAVGYALSPFTAFTKNVVSDPITRATGSRRAGDLADFAANLAVPGAPANRAAVKAGDTLAATKVGKTAEHIFSPTTVDADSRAAEATLRARSGNAARDTETTAARFTDADHQLVNGLDDAGRADFTAYVEGRSSGRQLANPALQGVADKMRDAFELRRAKLQALPSHAQQTFIDDYFPHIWENAGRQGAPPSSVGAGAAAKQGSGSFTKQRTIPTVADGIAQGLIPKTTNPIEATMAYVTNADRFIAMNEAVQEGVTQGAVRYMRPGTQPQGWVEIQGRLGTKANGQRGYAPESWARVFNNYVSPGFQGEYGSAAEMARKVSNSVTALELGLSGFHATTMAFEGVINNMARGIGLAREGKFKEAGKAVASAPAAPVTLYRRGKKVEQAYLNGTADPVLRQITDLLADAGGRATKYAHATDYQFSGMGSYWTAFKQGALSSQLGADAAKVGSARTLIGKGAAGAGVLGKQIGRAMDTVAQPLFEKYIPQVKNGAFYENMADWLKAHPNASHADQVKAAREIVDSVDNRFGELVQDNVFWNKALKQVSMVAMRSYSWNLGTVREIGGGVKDAMRGEWSRRSDYVVALAVSTGMMNATYQYLKTGKMPESIQDFVAPQTGGVDAKTGLPERLAPVGYMKDVFGWYEDPAQEAANKLATAPRMVGEAITGKDWKGQPIAPPAEKDAGWEKNVPEHLYWWAKHVGESMGPISMKAQAQGQKAGSNIGKVESFFGLRAAPQRLVDPEGYEAMMAKIRQNEWRRKTRGDERQKSLYPEE